MVAVEHVAVRITIACDIAIELPLTPQRVSQQPVVGARGHAVYSVVAAKVMSSAKFQTESAGGGAYEHMTQEAWPLVTQSWNGGIYLQQRCQKPGICIHAKTKLGCVDGGQTCRPDPGQ